MADQTGAAGRLKLRGVQIRRSDRVSAVVLADVCGKGPRAAAVTGLARYTLRAGAVNDHRPSRVLTMLNDALLREDPSRQLCTVIYARIDQNDDGFRLTCSSAGHRSRTSRTFASCARSSTTTAFASEFSSTY